MASVLELVVKNTICCGCGVCTSICPKHALAMQWNIDGEYNPVKVAECGRECGLCLSVCPFASGNQNEDEVSRRLYESLPSILYTPETGYYLTTGVGFVSSDEMRLHSVSGGLTTWILQKLISKNMVDGVLCVQATNDSNKLFSFTIAKTLDEIYAASGSAYYPVELSDVISYVLETPGRYAVVGVPCFLKALRLAQVKNKILKERLTVFIGLVCGMIPGKYLVNYMSYCAGQSSNVSNVTFRIKKYDKNADNYLTKMITEANEVNTIFWSEKNISFARQCLGLHACDCCDDVFAECADITFMDAWLPGYSADWKGSNIFLSRLPQLSALLKEGIEANELSIQPISIQLVIQSQKPRLDRKRGNVLSWKITCMERMGYVIPKKRIIETTKLSSLRQYIYKRGIQQKYLCRDIFRKSEYDGKDMLNWFTKMVKLPIPIRMAQFSVATAKYISRKIK